MIRLKSPDEIKILRQGGNILSTVLKKVAREVRPGVTTLELDELAEKEIRLAGGVPSFKNYGGDYNPYPATLCTSVNDQIVHGIPGDYILQEGDLIGLDVGMRWPAKNGLYTDMAVTVPVGKIKPELAKLISVTRNSLDIWIKNVKPGKDLNAIAKMVQDYVEKNGYSMVRDLVGHGVGYGVHEEPMIPNYYVPNGTLILKEGMVLAFEPMVSMGDYRIRTLKDGWTVVMADGSPCAHFEHTLAVTKRGNEVVTR